MNDIKLKNKESNNYPSIIHANGMSKIEGKPNYGSWPLILNECKKTSVDSRELRKDLTIITWKGGRCANTITQLEESCQNYGVKLLVLPWSKKNVSFWEDTKCKIYNTVDYIKSNKIKTEFLMGLDASDVVFIKHPNEILEDFINYYGNYNSVWCAEANDWPNLNTRKYTSYPVIDELTIKISNRDLENQKIHKCSTAFLNSGCFIARTKFLLDFYEIGWKIGGNLKTIDQMLVKYSQFLAPDKHAIDYECKIFQCLYNMNADKFELG